MPDITNPADRTEQRVDAATLRVTRRSTFTKALNTMDLPVTEAEWTAYQQGRRLIQDALPKLTGPQREFLLTGTTPEEWEAVFAEWVEREHAEALLEERTEAGL